ncbi:MAG: radical SAM-associated putative lipoprotein [Bacteroidales bacterium]|nr:radical SAM-associated putative lipoprotein [Bacteroidales bacterium]
MGKASRLISFVAAAVLAAGSLSSCEDWKVPSWIDDIIDKDTEHADFIMKGTVTGPDGNPLSGIRIEASIHREYSEYIETQTLSTSSDGSFSKSTETAQLPDELTFVFSDPREDYKTLTVSAAVERTKEEKGKYLGEFTVSVDVSMEKK